MSMAAKVILWGREIGAVALEDGRDVATFQFMPEFVNSGIEVSPIVMSLSDRIYSFPNLPNNAFKGLPGLLADSLPDYFGNLLINKWLESQGREADSINSVERLCYTGRRGMGALEYEPTLGPFRGISAEIDIDTLSELAAEILSQREDLKVVFDSNDRKNALLQILRVGTSAGGSRAKAIIAWNRKTNEVYSGQVKAGKDFEYWILKFDGVIEGEGDELFDLKGYGAIEYAYYKMATAAGIQMNPCTIFPESNRRHFLTQRFDRKRDGEKMHMQSLGAIAHYNYKDKQGYSYEQALLIIRKLGLPMSSIEQQYRRMVFNIIARNQDDHVKNIAFLMNKSGKWMLSPAFDVTYSYNPTGIWTKYHQMTMNNKKDDFELKDFIACANAAYIKRGRAKQIMEEVREIISKWEEFADEAEVLPSHKRKIKNALRLEKF
jgi:serine/threonine-protein kinase HipA